MNLASRQCAAGFVARGLLLQTALLVRVETVLSPRFCDDVCTLDQQTAEVLLEVAVLPLNQAPV